MVPAQREKIAEYVQHRRKLREQHHPVPLILQPLQDAVQHREFPRGLHQLLDGYAILRDVGAREEVRVVAALAELHQQRLQLLEVPRVLLLAAGAGGFGGIGAATVVHRSGSAAAGFSQLGGFHGRQRAALPHEQPAVPKRLSRRERAHNLGLRLLRQRHLHLPFHPSKHERFHEVVREI